MKTLEEMKSILTEKAKQTGLLDIEDFSVYDSSGGNFDDAFSLGCEAGEISFARYLLKELSDDAK